MKEPFDWDREWYEGAPPVRVSIGWREILAKHPVEAVLTLLLAAAGLVLAGVR